MSKKEYKSAVHSRRMITDALADLLHQKPLDKITVTDVVTHAGLNRGTFYAHYKDIPDVIHCVIEQMFSQIKNDALDHPMEFYEIPHFLLTSVRNMLESDLDFFRKVMTSNDYAIVEEQLVQLVLDYFLQHEKKFSTMNHEQYIFTIRFCAGGLSNLYHDWFLNKIPLSLDQLTAEAQNVLDHIIDADRKDL